MLFFDRSTHRTVDHQGQMHLTVTRNESGLNFVPLAVLPPEPAQVVTPTEDDRDGETSDKDDEGR